NGGGRCEGAVVKVADTDVVDVVAEVDPVDPDPAPFFAAVVAVVAPVWTDPAASLDVPLDAALTDPAPAALPPAALDDPFPALLDDPPAPFVVVGLPFPPPELDCESRAPAPPTDDVAPPWTAEPRSPVPWSVDAVELSVEPKVAVLFGFPPQAAMSPNT